MTLVTLFGRPGSGKSTVGDELATHHGFVHLPLGKMLKDAQFLRTINVDAAEVTEAVTKGRTIKNPNLYQWLDECIQNSRSIVVDGYPRAAISATPFAALVDSLPEGRAVLAVLMDCPTSVTHARLQARAREDDDERIAHRDDEFERVQLPLFESLPKRVRRAVVDASQAIPQALAQVKAALAQEDTGGGG